VCILQIIKEDCVDKIYSIIGKVNIINPYLDANQEIGYLWKGMSILRY
jgi:hypothetical protein